MLEGLDQFPWWRLRHLRGLATDTPRRIRELISDDEETRFNAAIDRLCDELSHQYAIFSATPYVCPYLIDLLRQGLVKDDEVLSEIMGLLVTCSRRGDRPRLTVSEAVKKGADVYPRYVSHPSPRVRGDAEELVRYCAGNGRVVDQG